MVRCSILGCKSDSERKTGITFHSFPVDPVVLKEWIAATGRNDWMPKKHSKICCKHFDKEHILKKGRYTYIHSNAVPFKLTKSDCTTIPSTSTTSEESVHCDNVTSFKSIVDKELIITPVIKSVCTANPSTSKASKESDRDDNLISSKSNMDTKSIIIPLRETQNLDLISAIKPLSAMINVKQCSTQSTLVTSPEFTPKTMKRKWKKEQRKSEDRLKKLKALREKSRRLNKKVADLEHILTELKSRSLVNLEECELLESIECSNKDFLKRIINPGSSSSKYSPSLRKFALSLHFISPRAYNFVRESFNSCLPHPSTIRSWYKSIDGTPGFTNESFECIKLLVKRGKGKLIYCALSLDEMAIRKHVQWDGEKCVGLVNFGEVLDGHNVAVAREALVFMVTAINDNWKMPVGYFLVDGCTGAQKATLVQSCIELLFSTGVTVISLTFDGCPANIAMAKCLGCVLNPSDLCGVQISFKIKEHEIVIFPDPAHMLKLVRNTLGEKKELTTSNDDKILWEYIVKLNNLQNNEGLHLANRLSNRHINFMKQIMKVKLAAQTFSNSVAESIDFCEKELGLMDFAGSGATVEFLKYMNNLFDVLNSRSFHTFGFKKPLNINNYHEIDLFLTSMEEYLVGLKLAGQPIMKTNRKVGFFGFYICIKSIKTMYRKFVLSNYLQFIPMYKLSQDHLECFFSSIRAKGGFNNNPTAVQFKAAYKRLVIHGEIKHVSSGNCIPLEDIKILTHNEISYEKKINLTTFNITSDFDTNDDPIVTIDSDHDYLADPSRLSIYAHEIITYIAGFVVKKVRQLIKCEECLLSLIGQKYHGLIAKRVKGGLIYPSKCIIKICNVAEKVFKMNSHRGISFYNDKNIMQKLVLQCFKSCVYDDSILNIHNDEKVFIGNHRSMLIKAVAMQYLHVRMHHSTKNIFAPTERIRNIHNKLVLFQGQ